MSEPLSRRTDGEIVIRSIGRHFSRAAGTPVGFRRGAECVPRDVGAVDSSSRGTQADDVLMEVLLRLWKRGKTFEALEHPGQEVKWRFVATRRVCLDLWRRRAREPQQPDLDSDDDRYEPDACLQDRDTLRSLSHRLSSIDREICVLYCEEQCTKVEVHRRVGRSRPSIDQRLLRVKRQLRLLEKD